MDDPAARRTHEGDARATRRRPLPHRHDQRGEDLPHEGEYLRLERPRLIEFTWISEATPTGSEAGAKVFLAGRSPAKLEKVAEEIRAVGGRAETAEVDALDEKAVAKHADLVAATAGSIDVALNAVGIRHVQGPPFAEVSVEDYAHPIAAYTRTNFLTAKAVARHMMKQAPA